MTNVVSIRLGESGLSLAARYPSLVKVQQQPAGLDFFEIDWNARAPGRVDVEHGKHAFSIEHVLSLVSSQDRAELKSEGLVDFSINAGVSRAELISHDEARLKIHAILRKLLDAGWQSITPRSRPRLGGRDRLAYVLDVSSTIGLDPAYIPSLNEWMRIENRTSWHFYAEGVYVDVMFARESTLMDVAKPGVYLLTFTIKSESEYFRDYVESENRLRWKEFLPKELEKVKSARVQKEAELRARGIKIDESYEDPPVPVIR